MNVAKVLLDTAKRFPQKPAIIFGDQPLSFYRLQENTFRLSNALMKLGIRRGEKVAIYLPNCPEYILSYLAVFSIGAVAVPLDFMLTQDELESCLSHAEVKLLIAASKEGILLEELKKRISTLEDVLLCKQMKEGFLSFEDILAKGSPSFPNVQIQDKAPSIIMYTSGTTAKPKGILWNYRHLDGPVEAMEYFVHLTDKDVKICCLPLSHSAGLVYVENCIFFGITLVLMEGFIPVEFLKNIQKYRVTCFHIVPSMYYAILQLKEFARYDLSSLRFITVFGAPSSPKALRRFHRHCPHAHLLNGWGMTETCPPNTVIPLGSKKIESVGKPAAWIEIKVFDEDNKEVPTGEVGELAIRGWVVMDGYYKQPEMTAEVMRDGWFHTGDLVRLDEEGYLYIVGRKKEMIKVGGQIVYAPEVEETILKNPAVLEAAVIGFPDKLRGEVPKAFIVLKEERSATEEDIRYFCRQHLAHFKLPHFIEIRESLPKTRTGKIDKEALKNEKG